MLPATNNATGAQRLIALDCEIIMPQEFVQPSEIQAGIWPCISTLTT